MQINKYTWCPIKGKVVLKEIIHVPDTKGAWLFDKTTDPIEDLLKLDICSN